MVCNSQILIYMADRLWQFLRMAQMTSLTLSSRLSLVAKGHTYLIHHILF